MPHDDLDALLREWHEKNAARALAGRDRLLSALKSAGPRVADLTHPAIAKASARPVARIRWWSSHPYTITATAAAMALAVGAAFLLMPAPSTLADTNIVNTADGGRLDALDENGTLIGPCPLKHTDVRVDTSGMFARVTLVQRFHNTYANKIEAVYTFPLSHRGAVDRMNITVGQRVVVGEVRERGEAREIYQAARGAGFVAGLLEQQRPNIFTQSVANIEPNAEVLVEISYIETLQVKDGLYSFDFPMVVSPRYVPGKATGDPLPAGLHPRVGVVELAPIDSIVPAATGDAKQVDGSVHAIMIALRRARPIRTPDESWWTRPGAPPKVLRTHDFSVVYPDGSQETGAILSDGTGFLNDRWFFSQQQEAGADHVESLNADATASAHATGIPMAPIARPGTRAGHDISLTVNLDTGGPGIVDVASQPHDIVYQSRENRPDGNPHRATLTLREAAVIPNRDFALSWRQTTDTINEAMFVHADSRGGFFTLVIDAPRVRSDSHAANGSTATAEQNDDRSHAPESATDTVTTLPRELVFVLDTSGSMGGAPIEKAKMVISKALDAMREGDTFNLITFSGDTHVLWPAPREASPENRALAQAFLAERSGGGGTEMMQAIEAALAQPEPSVSSQEQTASARPMRVVMFLTDGQVGNDMAIIEAVQRNAEHSRVFSFGIGDSPNRYLLEGMARAGRGDVEYVQLNGEADAAVARFSRRIESPVLVDISLAFSQGLNVTDMLPERVPDLFDAAPIILHGRYSQPGAGTLTIRGRTASGPYERVMDVDFPATTERNDVVATLWARAKVEELTNSDLAGLQSGAPSPAVREQIISLGVNYQIMSQLTSFVAVEHQRVTVGGEPMLVPVPIEMPHGQEWIEQAAAVVGTQNDVFTLMAMIEQTAKPLSDTQGQRGPAEESYVELPFEDALSDGVSPTQPTGTADERGDDNARSLVDGSAAVGESLRKREDDVVSREPEKVLPRDPSDNKTARMETDLDKLDAIAVNERLGRAMTGGDSTRPSAAPSNSAGQDLARPHEGRGIAVMSEKKTAADDSAAVADVLRLEFAKSATDGYAVDPGDKSGALLLPGSEAAMKPNVTNAIQYLQASGNSVGQSPVWKVGGRENANADYKALPAVAYGLNDEIARGQVSNPQAPFAAVRAPVRLSGDAVTQLGLAERGFTARRAMVAAGNPNASTKQTAYFFGGGSDPGGAVVAGLPILQLSEAGGIPPTSAPILAAAFQPTGGAWQEAAASAIRLHFGTLNNEQPGNTALTQEAMFAADVPASAMTTTGDAHEFEPTAVAVFDATRKRRFDLAAMAGGGQSLLLPQRIVLCIQQFVRQSRWSAALQLADALAAFDTGYTPGERLRDILCDSPLDESQRRAHVEAIADSAARDIADYFARQRALAERVDPLLLRAAQTNGAVEPPEQVRRKDGRLMVTLRLANAAESAIADLRRAGLALDAGVAPANIIAGMVAPDRLDDLALVDGVRRIQAITRKSVR